MKHRSISSEMPGIVTGPSISVNKASPQLYRCCDRWCGPLFILNSRHGRNIMSWVMLTIWYCPWFLAFGLLADLFSTPGAACLSTKCHSYMWILVPSASRLSGMVNTSVGVCTRRGMVIPVQLPCAFYFCRIRYSSVVLVPWGMFLSVQSYHCLR